MSDSPRLLLREVSFTYPGGSEVLHNVSGEFAAPDIHFIVGTSGSGKTTLALLLQGELSASRGSVTRVPDTPPTLVLQHPELLFLEDSISAEWKISKSSSDEARLLSVLQAFDLDVDIASHRSPFEFSFAERRLLAIAMMSARSSPFLILDEPTLGLDQTNMQRFVSWLQAEASETRLCVVITHDVDLLASCRGRVHVLQHRTIHWTGTTEEFLNSPQVRSRIGFE
ncbi:MAG: ATP-binding cassette domain-containing protein [Calditrichaeota bacterium]|nr:ATP-binding cassette domain-containing protein [Calditrichota bacterium]MCB9366288.1 ATP-binding cassette domain-containing protein [Calditrichota bacterium]